MTKEQRLTHLKADNSQLLVKQKSVWAKASGGGMYEARERKC
jgi:hypothetical protein